MMFPIHIVAQTEDFACGTENVTIPDPPNVYSYSVDAEYLDSFEPKVYNIFFWRLRRDDGTAEPVLEDNDFLIAVEKLNEVYSQFKICFNLIGYEYVNNTAHYSVARYPTNFPNENPPPVSWSALKSFAKSNNK